ncbi:MAG: aerobic carbon-monoxide dehydrogenase small subunit [Solirubrobacteraceae bacterium]|jgi:carbon-monoxide dehydrogenase small subunit|nr:aerobic carbon-monoxide dehydrogenase small subunit [Solirubrobacteraceae bacterium]
MSTIQARSTEDSRTVTMTVNGTRHERTVAVRLLLSDFLRHELGLTGTHVGCEHGVCGCCTVQIDGRAARSCLALAVQCEGADVRTVESLAADDGTLHPVQQAFHEKHALQCGFCTPGFLMASEELVRTVPGLADMPEEEIREALSGNLCRCTGYTNIVDAVRLAAQRTQGTEG